MPDLRCKADPSYQAYIIDSTAQAVTGLRCPDNNNPRSPYPASVTVTTPGAGVPTLRGKTR